MDLNFFKSFYLDCFPHAKEKATNISSNRINNDRFLNYMLGESTVLIESYGSSDISNIMNGNPPTKFLNSIDTGIIKEISKVVGEDVKGFNAQDVFAKIQSTFSEDGSEESSTINKIFCGSKAIEDFVVGIKWWFLLALLQKGFEKVYKEFSKETQDIISKLPQTKIPLNKQIDTFLKEHCLFINSNGERNAEIPYKYFHELRRILIDTASGTLYISGSTLGNAFSTANKDDAVIIDNLLDSVLEQRISEINVFIMDPGILGEPNLSDPIGHLNANINSLIDNLHIVLKSNNCKLNIYFLPFFDIDHVILTEEVMLYRTTKLWTRERDYKGSIMLFHKKNNVESYDDQGEYIVQKKYFDTLIENSVLINTNQMVEISSSMPSYLKTYYDIRNNVHNLHKIGNHHINLFKVYSTQLKRFIVSSFMVDKSRFTFNFSSENMNLFDSKNLLNDVTQQVLLPYIKKTESMLNIVVKKYDKRNESGVRIIPSLDLGYPNNIMRLAGGFATGMLIDWECGTPIIPIDATVNVCSSSVFKINPTLEILNDFSSFIMSMTQEAVTKCGYSFSFTSGNHFLMLATDKNNDYYLVLHSSPKEMKESYFGLYPREDNWYSSKIKFEEEDGRYIRYIKGSEAEYFIKTAHHFERYNEDIHRWIARQFNWIESNPPIIKHHYYMPTDSSIAIGTFAERPGEIVPIFSDVGKPVYLFEIGRDNWTYDLGGRKGEVCIVPHGWGQQIENVTEISLNDHKLCFKLRDNNIVKYDIISEKRIEDELNSSKNPKYNKMVRKFKSGLDFLKKGSLYISGDIVNTLMPQYLYCKSFCGKLKKGK